MMHFCALASVPDGKCLGNAPVAIVGTAAELLLTRSQKLLEN